MTLQLARTDDNYLELRVASAIAGALSHMLIMARPIGFYQDDTLRIRVVVQGQPTERPALHHEPVCDH